jgi:alkylated DNA repair protein (DNA oxidative demethylase)
VCIGNDRDLHGSVCRGSDPGRGLTPSRVRPIDERAPAGLRYEPDLITADEERAVLELIEPLEFQRIELRGQVAKRSVRQFGLRYEFGSWELEETEPLPGALEAVRERAAALAGVAAQDLVQTLVSRYPAGAGIGWHRDAPAFGRVVGVSLLSPCRMRFQRGKGTDRQTFALELEPRSGYLLSGSARWAWQHSIPATKALRYSLTFRTLRGGSLRAPS